MFERGIGVYSGFEIARLKSIIDSRVQALQDDADNAAHWAQVQEEDDERDTSWVMMMVLDGFLFGHGLEREKRKKRDFLHQCFKWHYRFRFFFVPV